MKGVEEVKRRLSVAPDEKLDQPPDLPPAPAPPFRPCPRPRVAAAPGRGGEDGRTGPSARPRPRPQPTPPPEIRRAGGPERSADSRARRGEAGAAGLPAELRGVLVEVATHSYLRYEWALLKPLVCHQLRLAERAYGPPEAAKAEAAGPAAEGEAGEAGEAAEGTKAGSPAGSQHAGAEGGEEDAGAAPTAGGLKELVDGFSEAPWTIRRLCEILLAPKRHYKSWRRLAESVEKMLLVITTVGPSGEGDVPPRPLLAGLREPNSTLGCWVKTLGEEGQKLKGEKVTEPTRIIHLNLPQERERAREEFEKQRQLQMQQKQQEEMAQADGNVNAQQHPLQQIQHLQMQQMQQLQPMVGQGLHLNGHTISSTIGNNLNLVPDASDASAGHSKLINIPDGLGMPGAGEVAGQWSEGRAIFQGAGVREVAGKDELGAAGSPLIEKIDEATNYFGEALGGIAPGMVRPITEVVQGKRMKVEEVPSTKT